MTIELSQCKTIEDEDEDKSYHQQDKSEEIGYCSLQFPDRHDAPLCGLEHWLNDDTGPTVLMNLDAKVVQVEIAKKAF